MAIGGRLAETILSRYKWHNLEASPSYKAATKLETLFGPSIWSDIKDKIVLDLGCGDGMESLEMARRGARHVFGLDIQEQQLMTARTQALGIDNCTFVQRFTSRADLIVSVDSFEHFCRPDLVLRDMATILVPGGKVLVSFGPPWYHPKGGHFQLFPWAHLLLKESALMTWRSRWKTDGATRFEEVAGGLNQMSVGKFERLVADSPLKLADFETVPIRAVRWLHCRLTRELFTSVVRCTLVARSYAP
jgi:SAM-dependent methyltransferase